MKLRPYTKNGADYWRVDCGLIDGKRIQKQFATKAAAEAFLSAKAGEKRRGGVEALTFSNDDRLEFTTLKARLAPLGATLSQAVDYFCKHQPRLIKSLDEAVAECVVAKLSGGRRSRYVQGLESYLRMFASGRGAVGVHEITTADIERWFVSRGEANGTLASNLGRLSALFSLCVRRGYCPVNPCDAVERIRIEHKAPAILSVDECERLLAVCVTRKPKLLGYVALCLFAGVRPEEAEKLDWSSVDLVNRRVVIDAAISKVRNRRVTELSGNAVAWLSLCERSGRVAPWKMDRRKKLVRALRKAAGVQWCQDIMRHTAASHWMASKRDAAFVADQLGNSPRVLLTNYRALVTPEDNAKFAALFPRQTHYAATVAQWGKGRA